MPATSAKQKRAMFAAAEGHSTLGILKAVGAEFVAADANNGHAAGILYVAPDGDVLLLRRADTEPNFGGYWSLPGGKGEPGETPEITALREAAEEMAGGPGPGAGMKLIDAKVTPTGMAFYTFAAGAADKFVPALNAEHTGFCWAPLNKLPQPMHPALAEMLEHRLGLYRTDVSPADYGELVARFAGWAHDNENPPPGLDAIAVDSESVRTYDADGRLHVSITPISKANICQYYGREIPGAAALGLEAERKYKLLRDPEELKKGAATFNGLPVMRRHVATSAADHKAEDTIGATGTDAAFEAPYLVNSLVIWPRGDIKDVEDALKKEISCGYRYRPDMTPGVFEGQPYDGVMRDIVGNHVAVVREGRAGPDVVVGDAKPEPTSSKGKFALDDGLVATSPNSAIPMGGKFRHPADCDCAECVAARAQQAEDSKEPTAMKTALSPKATLARGALVSFLMPRLAEDAAIDLPPLLTGITARNYAAKRPALLASVSEAVIGKLAKDQKLDGLDDVLMALDSVEAPDLPMPGGGKGKGPGAMDKSKRGKDAKPKGMDKAARDEAAENLKEKLKDKFGEDEDGYKAACDDIDGMRSGMDEDADEYEARREREAEEEGRGRVRTATDRRRAKDADPDDDEEDDDKKMGKDEVKQAVDEAIAGERTRQNAIRDALVFVRPWAGDLTMAFDSADDVYKHAVKARGGEVTGVHPSAFKSILKVMPKPGDRTGGAPRRDGGTPIAMDAAASETMAKKYPGMENIRLGG